MLDSRYESSPGVFHDKTGLTYGRLKVLRRDETVSSRVSWICLCECGNTVSVNSYSLTKGATQSCGCLHRERAALGRRTHGKSGSREHRVYWGMRRRCYYEKDDSYPWYGALGISVCASWLKSFDNFYRDMGPCPGEDYTIDRIDSTKNYEPGNCRWVTMSAQQNNKSSNRIVEYRGERMTVAELAKAFDFPYTTILNRLNRGLSAEEAVSKRHFQKKE